MAIRQLRRSWVSQPPAPLRLSDRARLLGLEFLLHGASGTVVSRSGLILPTSETPPLVDRGRHGRGLKFDGADRSYYHRLPTLIDLSSGEASKGGYSFVAVVQQDVLVADRRFFSLTSVTDNATSIALGSDYIDPSAMRSWSDGNHPAISSAPGVFVAGKPVVIIVRFDRAAKAVTFFADGRVVAAWSDSALFSVFEAKFTRVSYGSLRRNSDNLSPWNGLIYLAGLSYNNWTDTEIQRLTANPWSLFEQSRVIVPVPSGATVLVGATGSELHTASAGVAAQTHVLAGAIASQANVAATGAVAQTLSLAGATASQANVAATGAVAHTQTLSGAATAQANTAAAGAVAQSHATAAATASQANVSAPGAAVQTHRPVAATAGQANTAASAGIGQTLALAGAPANQVNTAASAAAAQTHAAVAAAASQANVAGTASVSQEHRPTAALGAQANTAAAGAAAQTHALVGAASTQDNSATVGSLSQTVTLVGAPAAQANTAVVAAAVQTHTLQGAASAVANTAPGAALAQTAVLSGVAGAQANSLSSGAIAQTHAAAGAPANQANSASLGSIGSEAVLDSAPAAQANTATVGAVAQTHALLVGVAAQAATVTSAAAAQTHVLAGTPTAQANTAELGSLGVQPIILGATPAAQANAGSAGAVGVTHLLVSVSSSQMSEATAAALSQTQVLLADVTIQINSAPGRAVGTGEQPEPQAPILNGIADYLAAGTPVLDRLRATVSLVPPKNFFRPSTLGDMTESSQPDRSIHLIYAGDAVTQSSAGRGRANVVDQRWLVVVAVRHPASQLQNTEQIQALAGPIISQVLDALQGWAPVEWMRPLERAASSPNPGFSSAFAYYPLLFQGRIVTS